MKYPPSKNSARISEIFTSLQGEGPRAGERHIFVRFEECHIHCEYCDELGKSGEEMMLNEVMEKIMSLEDENGPHSYISFTGGEPLLYVKFLKPLLRLVKASGFKVYLETDGILWRSLEEVIGWCDVIAMDMKPASVTKERNFYSEHEKFLKIAVSKEVFVKMVLSKQICQSEFDRLIEIIQEVDPDITVVLQPISTNIEGHEDSDLMLLLESLSRRAMEKVSNARIVPRLHRILNIP